MSRAGTHRFLRRGKKNKSGPNAAESRFYRQVNQEEFLPQLEDSNEPVRRDEAHERWLAMQSAYAEYLRASEAFENSREATCDSADLGRGDLMLLDSRRDALERYLEARMEYLERRYDDSYRRGVAMASCPTRDTGGLRTTSWLPARTGRSCRFWWSAS